MSLETFVKDACRTESPNFELLIPGLPDAEGEVESYDTARLVHAAFGMQTETAEFSEEILVSRAKGVDVDVVNLREELGDILWYVAIACDELKLNFTSLVASPKGARGVGADHSITAVVADFTDILKKSIFYGKPLDVTKVSAVLERLVGDISELCGILDTNLEAVVAKVSDKLKTRYPDKFTEESATNRDLDAERKVLEKNHD